MSQINRCCTSIEDCIHYRRCFMSGEYCSKQANIQKERQRIHDAQKINAFVIMNFSNMSDVVYKWRIKPFIESLKKYLWLEDGKIVCYSDSKKESTNDIPGNSNKRPVDRINVIRADTDTASNYVVCNRICQQIQMADLIIVDVSFENANVFYEFGMAVALKKLILPICYSESFFETHYPEKLEELLEKKKSVPQEIKRHIDCYPWRRILFEHFGIRFRSKKDSDVLDGNVDTMNGDEVLKWKELNEQSGHITRYLPFKDATNSEYGFSDVQYRRFPYLESVEDAEIGENGENTIGKKIYTRLGNTYNNSRYQHNTLVVYTLEGFLNEEQAGQCIVNFYNYYTLQMKDEYCFCGDRVGTLIQSNTIPESIKDAKTEKHLLYSVGEIIHLGVNEATYAAQRETIKTSDFLSVPNGIWGISDDTDWVKSIRTFTKGYVGNKSISVYPRTPVYVKRIKNGLQADIAEVEKDSWLQYYFCLYHIMLRTLKYTNELVVDISKTPLQSLFWLGAAHGLDINAIIVRHEESESERLLISESTGKRERPVFDVVGLWSAILRSDDTEGFYQQLTLAQKGIEQHSKLMLKNLAQYENQLVDGMYQNLHGDEDGDEKKDDSQSNILRELKEKEALDLESYYRDRFWKSMLSREHLRIYLPQVDGTDETWNEPKLNAVKWDVEAIATISHYLSVRTHIGEYSFQTIGKNEVGENAHVSNFITVGNDAKPLKGEAQTSISLAEYIHGRILTKKKQNESSTLNFNDIYLHREWPEQEDCPKYRGRHRMFKGFYKNCGQDADVLYTQLPQSFCYDCMGTHASEIAGEVPLRSIRDKNEEKCFLKGKKKVHTQLAQLILWREVDRTNNEVRFRVSLTGTSGPSTLALSTILVNEAQRAKKFKLEDVVLTDRTKREEILKQHINLSKEDLEGMENPLSDLQAKIRIKILDAFIKMLGEEGNSPESEGEAKGKKEIAAKDEGNGYARQIKYSAVLYLSSVLYRYFLPFLSLEEEKKLLHGMRYFLFSLLASETILYHGAKESHQILRKTRNQQLVEEIVVALKLVLHSFHGVEALYCAKVEVKEGINSDSRESLCIRLMDDDSVNCLFIP